MPGGQGGVVPGQGQREEVALDRGPDELVTEADRGVALDQEAMLDALGETRRQVRVEDAMATPQHVRGAWGRAIRLDLEVGGDRRQAIGIERPARRAREGAARAGTPSTGPRGGS